MTTIIIFGIVLMAFGWGLIGLSVDPIYPTFTDKLLVIIFIVGLILTMFGAGILFVDALTDGGSWREFKSVISGT